MQIEHSAEVALSQLNDFEFPEPALEDFTLERVIIVTRALQDVFYSKALALVPAESAFPCPHCGSAICRVKIGSLEFCAEVDRKFVNQLLINIIAAHECRESACR